MQVIQAPGQKETKWPGFIGKVTVIDFWATWCGPCVESIPHWNELASSFEGQAVQFIAISSENEAVVRKFLKRTAFKSWVAVEGVGRSLSDLYGVSGIPTTVLVNKDGIVAAVTHPARLRAKDIEEVLTTGESSIQPIEHETARSENFEREPVRRPLLELSVRPSGPRPKGRGFNIWSFDNDNGEMKGESATLGAAILNCFHTKEVLLDCRTTLPQEEYEFLMRMPAAAPADQEELFKSFFKTTFGLRVSRKNEPRQVYVVTRSSDHAPGLTEPVQGVQGGGGNGPGRIDLRNLKIEALLGYFESFLGKVVIDETGMTNRYDAHFRWELSKGEILLLGADPAVQRAIFSDEKGGDEDLTGEQKRLVNFLKGTIPESELEKFPAEEREGIRLARLELAKPEQERFNPPAEVIMAAAREQLGLKFTAEQRPVSVLVVEKAAP